MDDARLSRKNRDRMKARVRESRHKLTSRWNQCLARAHEQCYLVSSKVPEQMVQGRPFHSDYADKRGHEMELRSEKVAVVSHIAPSFVRGS